MTRKKTRRRDIFSELLEGIGAMKAHREGKMNLRKRKARSAERIPRNPPTR
jgi:hypothetical protein